MNLLRSSSWLLLALLLVVGAGCEATDEIGEGDDGPETPPALADQVDVLESYDVSAFNDGLEGDTPTVDVAFYVTEGGPASWDNLVPNIERAKRIFAGEGLQLRVTSALLIAVPDAWQTLDPEDSIPPKTPEYAKTDLYAHLNEQETRLTRRNQDIFEAITWHLPERSHGVTRANMVHAITLRDVPISYYEWTGSEWTYNEVPTGALSFPPYMYAGRIPRHLRGVITLSIAPNQWSPASRTLAHELGHKLINVSHEGIGVCPTFATEGDDLMLYGTGERIPGGSEGRFQKERLQLSPFLYRLVDGQAEFSNRFEDGGVYRDGLYGDLIVDPLCTGE